MPPKSENHKIVDPVVDAAEECLRPDNTTAPCDDSEYENPRQNIRYKPEFDCMAQKLCSMGATDADLAIAFNTSLGTIANWQDTYGSFAKACTLGIEHATNNIKRSLAQRARGYEYVAEKVIHYQGRSIVCRYLKHVPADVSAGQFWLVNHCPEEFRCSPEPAKAPEGEMVQFLRQLQGTRLMPKDP